MWVVIGLATRIVDAKDTTRCDADFGQAVVVEVADRHRTADAKTRDIYHYLWNDYVVDRRRGDDEEFTASREDKFGFSVEFIEVEFFGCIARRTEIGIAGVVFPG